MDAAPLSPLALLDDDSLRLVLLLAADSAGTYFVCWRWARALRARFGEYAGYERAVSAGVRLGLACGDWSGYRVTLCWFGVRSFALRCGYAPSWTPPQAAVRGTPDEDITPELAASHAYCRLHNDLTTPGAEVRITEIGNVSLFLSEETDLGPLYTVEAPGFDASPDDEMTNVGLLLSPDSEAPPGFWPDSVPITSAMASLVALGLAEDYREAGAAAAATSTQTAPDPASLVALGLAGGDHEAAAAAAPSAQIASNSASLVAALILSPGSLAPKTDAECMALAPAARACVTGGDAEWRDLALDELGSGTYYEYLGDRAASRRDALIEASTPDDDGLRSGDVGAPLKGLVSWTVFAHETEARVAAATLRAQGARVSIEDADSASQNDDIHEVMKACMLAGFLDGDQEDDPVWAAAARRPAPTQGV